jgi:hypothetical protein
MTADGVKGHTPLPWQIAGASKFVGTDINIIGPGSEYICLAGQRGDATAEANAALIVHSVNTLPALVQALENANGLVREILDDYDALPPDRSLNWHEWADRARAALTPPADKAGGGK